MKSQEEVFDIFDASMRPIGTATRKEAHAEGLWHQTFQCWIWQETAEGVVFLFQMRHPGKDTFPGLLDISCAGHLLAGERVEDGVREMEEELGLSVPFEELISCGIFPEEDDLGPHGVDREFCHLFLYRCDRPLDGFRLQPDEVTGLYCVPLESVRQMAENTFKECQMEGVKLEEDGTLTAVQTTAKAAEFVPHPAAYYGQLLKTWDRHREMDDTASGK